MHAGLGQKRTVGRVGALSRPIEGRKFILDVHMVIALHSNHSFSYLSVLQVISLTASIGLCGAMPYHSNKNKVHYGRPSLSGS
jgi:hypothetical protein